MDAALAVVLAAAVSAAPPVYARVLHERETRSTETERRDRILLEVEAAAFERARSYDLDVINSLTARIERAEQRADVAERRATAAERRVAVLERTLLVNGIKLPNGNDEPQATLPEQVRRLIKENGDSDPPPATVKP